MVSVKFVHCAYLYHLLHCLPYFFDIFCKNASVRSVHHIYRHLLHCSQFAICFGSSHFLYTLQFTLYIVFLYLKVCVAFYIPIAICFGPFPLLRCTLYTRLLFNLQYTLYLQVFLCYLKFNPHSLFFNIICIYLSIHFVHCVYGYHIVILYSTQ